MAEEESGFTFVDRRHVQASDTPEPDTAEPSVPLTAEDALAADAASSASEDAEAPDIYGVLGYCISLLATEAWQKLGLLADPQSGEATMDLAQAKVAIDAVGDLAARLDSAPEEAVPASLRRDLKTLLNDLRLNYVSRRGDTATSRN